MARTSNRVYSRYTKEAITLFGKRLRAARIEKRYRTVDLAERAGISRDLLYRIESGDPRCEIGVAFEIAAILDVALFEPDESRLAQRNREMDERLALLPKAIHLTRDEVDDDF